MSKTNKSYIVGITGGSASGKSIFLNLLKKYLSTGFVSISQDNYYKSRELQPIDVNGIKNFDTPESFYSDDFIKDITTLASGQKASRIEYTYNNPAAKPGTIFYEPAPLIIVEGLFLLNNPSITKMLDLSVYIEAEEHLKLKRRIIRDKEERGYDLDDVLYRYEHHVYPCYEKYIKPFKSTADLIIPNNKDLNNSIEVVGTFLKNKMTQI